LRACAGREIRPGAKSQNAQAPKMSRRNHRKATAPAESLFCAASALARCNGRLRHTDLSFAV